MLCYNSKWEVKFVSKFMQVKNLKYDKIIIEMYVMLRN